MPDPKRSLRSRFLKVALPFFRSEARGRAFGGCALLVALLITINGVNVVNSYVGRDCMSALAERHASEFFLFAAVLAGVFAVSTIVEVFSRYVEQRLGLTWRDWLTRRFLDRYLANRTYLRLADHHEVDNPDERISEDVRTFTATTFSFLVLVVNGVLTLAAFSGVLWSITPWLFLVALGYAVLGSLGTVLIGRRLVPLNNQQLRKEADFRYGLVRVRLRDLLIGGCAQQVSEDRLHEVLREVGLEEVIARAGGLDAEHDWTAILSPSELQALTFARLLLASPRFAYLDDPAENMEPSRAERLYRALAHSPITYVSAGCSPVVLAYHDWRLELQEDGSWRIEPVETAARPAS